MSYAHLSNTGCVFQAESLLSDCSYGGVETAHNKRFHIRKHITHNLYCLECLHS